MNLKRYIDPSRFHADTAAHLSLCEAENNLIIGVLSGVIAGEYRDAYMAVIERDGDIARVLLRTPPHPVLISHREKTPSEAEVHLAIDDLYREYGDGLVGITGDKQAVRLYADTWTRTTGKRARLRVALRIYKVTQVKPAVGIPGAMRCAEDGDRELLAAWFRGFHKDAHGEAMADDQAQALVDRDMGADRAQRGLMIWEVDGVPVSMAGYAGPTPHGIRVSAVYTPPAQRKRGYASACVSALSQRLLDEGRDYCFLFTDLKNSTANHIYQEIGYRAVSDVDSYVFEDVK